MKCDKVKWQSLLKNDVIILFVFIVCCFCVTLTSCKPENNSGAIFGTVVDKATTDPISGAGVELLPKGLKTVTGLDGTFEFTQIDPGDYNLFVTKTGYLDLKSNTITVTSGETAKGDVQIEKLPLALRVVDSEGKDVDTLDFGAEQDVTSRSFSVFNDSPQRLTWWIEENCSWIVEVKSMLTNNQSGQVEAGKQEPIKVTIDRTTLGLGIKSYMLNINSDNGSKELLITAGEDVGLPSLVTQPVSNLIQNSVTFNGKITYEGAPAYTERGFVYSTEPRPSIENNLGIIPSALNDQSSFSAIIDGLSPNTTYYVSAYAKNLVGVAYGGYEIFKTLDGLASVETKEVINITQNSARCGGDVKTDNGYNVTERGICWSIYENPLINDDHVYAGSGVGEYFCDMSNLSSNTKYYVRAYAINSNGIKYGDNESFITPSTEIEVTTNTVTSITTTTAICGGSASVEIGNTLPVTARGVCWSTNHNPTIDDNHTDDGSGVGSFVSAITGLTLNTTYYVRAYATNEIDTYYGEERPFTTTDGLPSVVTFEPVLNDLTIVSGGNITSDGGYPVTARGICYGTTPFPDLSSSHSHTFDGSGTGSFSSTFTMSEVGVYYICAYATNTVGTFYGEQKTINHPYNGLLTFTCNGQTYRMAPAAPTTLNWNNANSYCNNLTLYGFSDWRLPTELELYDAFYDIPIIFSGYYTELWTSNECAVYGSGASGHLLYWRLGGGPASGCRDDNELGYVRPVRVEN